MALASELLLAARKSAARPSGSRYSKREKEVFKRNQCGLTGMNCGLIKDLVMNNKPRQPYP